MAAPNKDGTKTSAPASFWEKLLALILEAITFAEGLVGPGNGVRKKNEALERVMAWYQASGIRVPYLPGPVERWFIRRLASDLIDALVRLLNHPQLENAR